MSTALRYHAGAERPALKLWLLDDDGALIDFSSGYSYKLRIGEVGAPAILEKTSGIAGAAGSGVEPTGTPNITVTWSAGELDLPPGAYTAQLTATTVGLDRVFTIPFRVLATIAAP